MIEIKTFDIVRTNPWSKNQENETLYKLYMHDILVTETYCLQEAESMAKNLSTATGLQVVNTIAKRWFVEQSYIFADTKEEALSKITVREC